MATMMQTTQASRQSVGRWAGARVRRYAGNRRVLVLLALLVVGAGLALNWSWLVAAGIAPVVLLLAPCAAMCALGMCGRNTRDQASGDTAKLGAEAGTEPKRGAP